MREKRHRCHQCGKTKRESYFYNSGGRVKKPCKKCHAANLRKKTEARIDAGERRCHACGKWKLIAEFVVDGIAQAACTECHDPDKVLPSKQYRIVKDGKKHCKHCKGLLPLSEFHKNKTTSSGLQSHCKTCQSSHIRRRNAQLRKEDPEAFARTQRERVARAKARNPEKYARGIRESEKAYRYGITLEELRELQREADGKCQLCGDKPDKLHVDHDHVTEEVRGLLCPKCNKGIGFFQDKPEMLRAAIDYLTNGRRITPTRKRRGETGRIYRKAKK